MPYGRLYTLPDGWFSLFCCGCREVTKLRAGEPLDCAFCRRALTYEPVRGAPVGVKRKTVKRGPRTRKISS